MIIEGVEYSIKWSKFVRGASFFIPCLNTSLGRNKVRTVLRRAKKRAEIRVVIEDGIKGLRIWRI
jgi:hypothetical protein